MRPIEGNYETHGGDALSAMRNSILPTRGNYETLGGKF